VRIGGEEVYFVSGQNTKEYCNCPNDVDPKSPSQQSEGTIAVGRLRLDGLFSLDAPYSSAADAAVLETKPFIYSGSQLILNLDANSGSVVVSVFVSGGDDELPVLVSAPLVHSDVDQAVRFLNRPNSTSLNVTGIAALSGTPIWLRLRMQSCQLYSFRFDPSTPAPAPPPPGPPPPHPKGVCNITTIAAMWTATGCSNTLSATSGEQSYWESTPCATAAGDMFLYCSVTKAGTATNSQLAVCGSVQGACTMQHPRSSVDQARTEDSGELLGPFATQPSKTDDDDEPPPRRFRALWNQPWTEECQSRLSLPGGPINISAWGIEANGYTTSALNGSVIGGPAFNGDVVSTLYPHDGTGLYPSFYCSNGAPFSESNCKAVNGGSPQLGNLTAHLAQWHADIIKNFADPKSTAVVALDWENWWPIWCVQ
jgi:hypothetical protein